MSYGWCEIIGLYPCLKQSVSFNFWYLAHVWWSSLGLLYLNSRKAEFSFSIFILSTSQKLCTIPVTWGILKINDYYFIEVKHGVVSYRSMCYSNVFSNKTSWESCLCRSLCLLISFFFKYKLISQNKLEPVRGDSRNLVVKGLLTYCST